MKLSWHNGCHISTGCGTNHPHRDAGNKANTENLPHFMSEKVANIHQEKEKDTNPKNSAIPNIPNHTTGKKPTDQTTDHNDPRRKPGRCGRGLKTIHQIAGADHKNRIVANHAHHINQRDGDEGS